MSDPETEDAAIRAGMGNEHNLELLSEPESAAVYTLKTVDSTHSQIRVSIHYIGKAPQRITKVCSGQ